MCREWDSYEDTEMCTGFLVKEPDGKRPLGETRCRGEDNIKMAFKVIEFYGVDCVHVTELRHRLWALYMVVNFRIAYNNGSFLTN
jgi:hypothetical protein